MSKRSAAVNWAIRFYLGPGPLKRLRKVPIWLVARAVEAHYVVTRKPFSGVRGRSPGG